ncbi:BsuBI/PstI family type II restriction endonuclease, partial [Nocardia carnea]|uniref:BsuBI/PstI family type II restriction endonuclease n=1 Tax=Nocardia carnea TaxID=37328 RepID=UPI00245839CD
GTPDFAPVMSEYLDSQPGLVTLYRAAREATRIPITLPGGKKLSLGAGGQNVLIEAIIYDFCGRYVHDAEVLYIGDADSKFAHFEDKRLAELGITVNQHGKMPDLVVYQPSTNWLLLMEAVGSHGPVDAMRRRDLSVLFGRSTADLVFVSCFPDRATMRKYLVDLAWETEAWVADEPTHMIHMNGGKLLGPYRSN